MDYEPGISNWLVKKTQKKCSIKVIQTATRVQLSNSESTHVSRYWTRFPPNKCLTRFTTYILNLLHYILSLWELLSVKSKGQSPPGVGDGQGSLEWYSQWGLKESDTTEQLNWAELT